MKPERFKRTKSVVVSTAIALVVAALVMGLSSLVIGFRSASSGPERLPGAVLVSSTTCGPSDPTFCVTPPATAPVLYPQPAGATPQNMSLALSSSLSVSLNVYKMVVTITSPTTFPTHCPASNFQFNDVAFSTGSTPTVTLDYSNPSQSSHWAPITMASGGNKGTGTYPGTLALVDNGDQTSCHSMPLTLSFSASAYYTDTTTTSLASSPGTSYPGNPVTLTATVTPANPAVDSSESSPPTLATESSPNNQVKFYSCTSPATSSCSTTAFSSGAITYNSVTGYTASTTVSPSAPGSYYYEAIYPGSGTNSDYSASPPSNVVTQTVQFSSACVSPPTSGANIILTGTTSGNYAVPSGKSVWLNGGTITGNVTVPANGSFAATKGTLKGNFSSSGGPVSLQGTTVSGDTTSTGGGVAIGAGSVLSGNLTDSGAGSVCAVGTSSSPVQISNDVTVKNQPTSSVPNSFCALTLKGNLTYETNGAPLVIGGSSGCPSDTISGNVLVESNTAPVTVGGSGFGNTVKTNMTVESNAGTVTVYGNSVSGNIAVESNTGGGTLTSNSASSSCTLSGNHPQITVPSSTSNSAKGTNNCKVSG